MWFVSCLHVRNYFVALCYGYVTIKYAHSIPCTNLLRKRVDDTFERYDDEHLGRRLLDALHEYRCARRMVEGDVVAGYRVAYRAAQYLTQLGDLVGSIDSGDGAGLQVNLHLLAHTVDGFLLLLCQVAGPLAGRDRRQVLAVALAEPHGRLERIIYHVHRVWLGDPLKLGDLL